MSDAYIARAAAACAKADTPARVAIIVYSTLEEITEMALPYDARLTAMRRILELATAQGVDPFATTYDYNKGMFLADVLYQWKELPGNRDILRLMVEVGLDPSTPVVLGYNYIRMHHPSYTAAWPITLGSIIPICGIINGRDNVPPLGHTDVDAYRRRDRIV